MTEPLLNVHNITLSYGGALVLDRVNLTIFPGKTLALVGPSGSGKSSLARALLRLQPVQSGEIRFEGQNWLSLKGAALRQRRARMQMVFQDPLSAFNPRSRVQELLQEPLRIHGVKRDIGQLLEEVGLDSSLAFRRAHEISGGQRQRIAIARALATRPSLIVFDEAVSALDVTVRAGILNLLQMVQNRDNTAYLFITHDLAVASQLAHHIAVMQSGKIVECQPTRKLIASPQALITKALIEAAPRFRPRAEVKVSS